jgi:putative ABC transport system substrate-binding protein
MIRLAVISFVVWALAATAPFAGEKLYRLGIVGTQVPQIQGAMLQELAKLGFSEGRNLVLDRRVGDTAALPDLARELVLAKPDAIYVAGTDALRAASAATNIVPIVQLGPDPVRVGLAASLARPGGNVTGVAILGAELDGKRLSLLHEVVPDARPIAALVWPWGARQTSEQEMRAVAAQSHVDLLVFEAAGPEDYPAAFARMRAAGVEGVVLMATPVFYRDGALILRLAVQTGLPTVCEWAEMVQDGCLIGYGPNQPEVYRTVAHYIARILEGTAPSDLPIEQPTHYDLAVNLKTANKLGLAIPPWILARATEVIE